MESKSDEEKWEYVKPRGRTGHRRLAAVLAKEAAASQTKGTSAIDVASITADHQRLCRKWCDSEPYKQLCAIISDNAARHTAIRTAICLGLGSFDPRDERMSHDAHVQLEAFRAVVKMLERHNGRSIQCYVQEPSFGPSDKEFCKTLGVEVVDTPEAFQYVQPDTFVFAIHLPNYVWHDVLSKHLPGLCVGMHLDSLETLSTALLDDATFMAALLRIRTMYMTADRFAFPKSPRGTKLQFTFSGADILWSRKEVVAEMDEDKT